MRIISCREDEGLVIGDDICVTVLQIQSDSVRLAISSPQLTPSYREETLFFHAEEKPGALQLSSSSLTPTRRRTSAAGITSTSGPAMPRVIAS